jgi:hypothetical protein
MYTITTGTIAGIVPGQRRPRALEPRPQHTTEDSILQQWKGEVNDTSRLKERSIRLNTKAVSPKPCK